MMLKTGPGKVARLYKPAAARATRAMVRLDSREKCINQGRSSRFFCG